MEKQVFTYTEEVKIYRCRRCSKKVHQYYVSWNSDKETQEHLLKKAIEHHYLHEHGLKCEGMME